ncbi:uncharacterized protein METZ01_LOCUS276339 [marine metagenome]|uniref:Outer membrane protein beta-barrel domain-containing protein n=1 Tax=marine metagenome TaxID=408172 RepID=A0A382KIR3_9ZZZZ
MNVSQIRDLLQTLTSSIIWPKLLAPMAGMVLVVSPLVAQGQQSGSFQRESTLTIAVGSLRYKPSGNERFPMLALHRDQAVSRWARLETSMSFSRANVQIDSIGRYDSTLSTEKATLFTLTLGAQARWGIGPLEPYAGLALGIFVRRDDNSDGRRFSRPAYAFPLGVRVKLTDSLGIRGEIRFRQDSHEVVTHSDREMTVGITWTR